MDDEDREVSKDTKDPQYDLEHREENLRFAWLIN